MGMHNARDSRTGLRTRGAVALAAALGALAIAAPGTASAQASSAGFGPCPTFKVLHNDRIGPAVLPQGTYEIKLLIPNFTCANASKRFTQFLKDYDGNLPAPWGVIAKGSGTAIFTRSGQNAFRVMRISGGGGGGGGGGSSTKGQVCPGNFRVLNNDRIGPLRFPKGRYRLVVPKGSIITCPNAAKLFRQFLNRPSGNLPKNWRMKRTIALFYKPANPKRKKFRVDPGV
jgi:hypothetical protein